MWFQITSFLQFLIKSTNQHGVHSPFVFSFTTKCLYAKTPSEKKTLFNTILKEVSHNKQTIKVTDFGNGSKVFKSDERKICDIANIAGISRKKAFLLMRIAAYFNAETILELGTSIGLSSSALALGNKNASITTLEGCKNTSEAATALFKKFNLHFIKIITGNFTETLPKVTSKTVYDLIYFDGNHQKEATLHYFNSCLNAVHNNSICIFDDINWSSEMQEAWEEIKNNPKVTVTINTFFWGMVFFRKEQVKQHFTIRV